MILWHKTARLTLSSRAGSEKPEAQSGEGVVAKAPEKKGTTKTRRHKVFSGPATPGRQKRLPLCLGVFVVQRFYAFCDTLGKGWLPIFRKASPARPRRPDRAGVSHGELLATTEHAAQTTGQLVFHGRHAAH